MTKGAIVCGACGAKVRATRTRCPRCRAVLATGPPSEVRLSGRAAKITGGLLAVAAIATVVILWRGEGAPPTSQTKPAAPSASPQPAATSVAEVPSVPPFELAPGLTPVTDRNDVAAALADYQRALERDPQDAATLYSIGRLLLQLGRQHEALGPLKQAFALKADNWSYAFSTGYAFARASRFPEAVPAFRAARGLKPDDAVTSYDLALALQRQGDFAGAAEEYAAAIRLNSAAVSPRLGLAISLDRLGKASEAVAAYDECLQVMPAGPDADRVRARAERLRGA
jgi:tetratricopeptide (TPR) repeat protein